MNLIELRSHIIEKIEDAYSQKSTRVLVKTKIIDLFQHVKYLQSGPVCYVKNKAGNLEYLAHGAYQVYDGLKLANINNDQFIFGAEKFPTKSGQHNNGYFFRPIVLYKKSDAIHETEICIDLDYDILTSKKA